MKAVAVDGNPGAPGTDYMYHNEGHGLRNLGEAGHGLRILGEAGHGLRSLGEAGWQIVEVRRGVNPGAPGPTPAAYKQFVWCQSAPLEVPCYRIWLGHNG
jgi:hypothetical protein